jgi:hypothetical protein
MRQRATSALLTQARLGYARTRAPASPGHARASGRRRLPPHAGGTHRRRRVPGTRPGRRGGRLATAGHGLRRTLGHRQDRGVRHLLHLRDGLTVVVSSTLSLQEDQAASLGSTAFRAAVPNSARSARAQGDTLAAMRDGTLDVLLLAPEQLGGDAVVEAPLPRAGRSARHRRGSLRQRVGPRLPPGLPADRGRDRAVGAPAALALTVTASRHVRDDIVARLDLDDPAVVVGDEDRPNIWLSAQGRRRRRGRGRRDG